MSTFITLSRAQLRGRGGGLIVAAVAGLAPPLLAHLMPAWIGVGPNLATVLWAVTQLIALFAGLALFGEDLGSRRLAFFFARGVSGVAVWGARLAAGVAHALAMQALLLLPTLLWWPPDTSFAYLPLRIVDVMPPVWLLALVTAALVCGGALAGILGRARSRWLLVDAVAAGAVVVALAWTVREVLRVEQAAWAGLGPAWNVVAARIEALQLAAVVGALISFSGASAAAIILGRGGVRRGHAAASLALWTVALPIVAGCAAYARWILPAM